MRKPNVQSPLDRLEDAKQHKLYELLKGASYEEALPKVRAEFGVDLDNGGKVITAADATKGLKPFVKE